METDYGNKDSVASLSYNDCNAANLRHLQSAAF